MSAEDNGEPKLTETYDTPPIDEDEIYHDRLHKAIVELGNIQNEIDSCMPFPKPALPTIEQQKEARGIVLQMFKSSSPASRQRMIDFSKRNSFGMTTPEEMHKAIEIHQQIMMLQRITPFATMLPKVFDVNDPNCYNHTEDCKERRIIRKASFSCCQCHYHESDSSSDNESIMEVQPIESWGSHLKPMEKNEE